MYMVPKWVPKKKLDVDGSNNSEDLIRTNQDGISSSNSLPNDDATSSKATAIKETQQDAREMEKILADMSQEQKN